MLKQDNTCKSSENALKVHIWVHLLEDEVPKDDTQIICDNGKD